MDLCDVVVDVEFNRLGKDPKLSTKGRRIYPDIIVHQRKNSGKNLLAIELKKKKRPGSGPDPDNLGRLKEFTKRSDLRYAFGAAGNLGPKEWKSYWVKDGESIF